MSSASTRGGGALSGVRVLDFTQVLSGPYCTQILADLGADVIKVESPLGDVARTMPPHFVDDDSIYYLSINRNKRSIVLDLKTQEGLAIARRLALASDVVIENFRPGVLAKLGLAAAAIREEKPALVWCSISGFGQSGPYRDKQAYDLVVQAIGGGMSLTGEPDGHPVRAGIPIADIAAGMYGAIGILAALNRARETGRGDYIDVSMLDCQAAMLCYQAGYFLHSGDIPGRQGRGHDSIAAYRSFAASDGVQVVVAAMTQPMWERLCNVLGRDDLLCDERFADGKLRRENREALWEALEPAFLTRTADAWVEALEEEGVPVGTVNTLDRVVSDPQVVERGMVVNLDAADGRRVQVMGDPLFMQESRRASHTYPPAAGENSAEILAELLAMPQDRIEALVQSGAVGAANRQEK